MTLHAPLLSSAPKTEPAPTPSYISTKRQVPYQKYLPWINRGKTATCRPEFSFFPTSASDLQEIVCLARETGKQVRVVGQGHAWSELVPTHDMLVFIEQLNEVSMDLSDPDNPLVIVEAGADVRQVNNVLEQYGYALPTNVVMEHGSWGGLLATGSHGSGWNNQSLSDSIQWMEIVDGIGRLRRFETGIESEEVMNASRLHLGMFGITYRVALRVEKSWRVYEHDCEIPLEAAIDHMKGLVTDHESVEFHWWAFTDKVWMKSWDRTELPITDKPRVSKWQRIWSYVISQLQGVIFFILHRFPVITPILCRCAYWLAPTRGRKVVEIVEAIHAWRAIEGLQTGCMEFAFKIDEEFEEVKKAFRIVLDKVDAYAAQGKFPMNMSMNLRFIAQSDCLLSPAQGPGHTCYIEILGNSDRELWKSFSAEVALEWLKLPGAKPHWGKEFQHVPGIISYLKDVSKEQVSTFTSIKKNLGMDPDGIFMNPLLNQLFI
ncbi:MAG: FAD-binding protein [Bacteroidota bacterium]